MNKMAAINFNFFMQVGFRFEVSALY
jgi:hypothetical protein